MQSQIVDDAVYSSSQQQYEQIGIKGQSKLQSSVSVLLNTINQACHSSIRHISELATNLAYNAKHSSCPFVNRKAIQLYKGCEPAYLLGCKYGYKERHQFEEHFRSIIWICYRSELEGKFGDVGWGCMIRVCQMVLAQVLRKCKPLKHVSQIIEEFSSSNTALFSFDKICMEGKIMNRWTSSTEIMIALQQLLKEQTQYKLNIEMYNGQVSIEDVEQPSKYPMLMVVNNRLGANNVEQKMRDHLYTVLQHSKSIGMITGIGGQAIYVAGYFEGQLIALDPHYVQSENQGEKSYFNSIPRGVMLQKIVPAVGFCFFFQTAQQHREWLYDLAQTCHFHRPNLVIQFQSEFCKQVYELRHPKIGILDQQFQQLQ